MSNTVTIPDGYTALILRTDPVTDLESELRTVLDRTDAHSGVWWKPVGGQLHVQVFGYSGTETVNG